MSERSPITTHILDTSIGRPAAGVPLTLEYQDSPNSWKAVGKGKTNADGRVEDLISAGSLQTGVYRLNFHTGDYFRAQKGKTFYPFVTVVFEVTSANEHYHVPLLLSGHGYSTYRGS